MFVVIIEVMRLMGKEYREKVRILSVLYKPVVSGLVVFVASFLTTVTVSHFTAPVVDISATISPDGYYLNLLSPGDVAFSVNAIPGGTTAGFAGQIKVTTNSPSGYKLYISTGSNNVTAGNRLNLNGDLAATNFLAATSGSMNNPATLDSNSWGYALSGGNFNHNGNMADSTNLYSAMPLKGSEQLIKTRSSAAPAPDGDITNIYYGVKANASMPAGSYSNTVIYTAITEASNINGGEATISPNSVETTGGATVTITTSLKGVNSINGFSVSDLGSVTATIGGSTCTNLSTSLSAGVAMITCNVSAKSVGTYNVVVSFSKLNKTYTINNGITYTAPLNTIFALTNMQDMTAEHCSNTATPSASASIMVNSLAEYTNPNTQVPQVVLTDTRRGNKGYVVRKLADGKCWMTQNLDLGDSSTMTLTSSDTDITSNFTLPATYSSSWGTSLPRMLNMTDRWVMPPASTYSAPSIANTAPSDSTMAKTQHIGNYYNNRAITAQGRGSICPKGWKLPDLTDFNGLLGQISGTGQLKAYNAQQTPYSLVMAGYRRTNVTGYTISSMGAQGYVQGSGAFIDITSSGVNVSSGNSSTGRSVRCVAR